MATLKFDKGPNASWATKFANAPHQFYINHPAGRFRTEFGPVYYRGRLNSSVKLEPSILNYRNSLFDKIAGSNTLHAIVSFGNGADLAVTNWPGRPAGVPWFQLVHPSAPDNTVLPNWNAPIQTCATAWTPVTMWLWL